MSTDNKIIAFYKHLRTVIRSRTNRGIVDAINQSQKNIIDYVSVNDKYIYDTIAQIKTVCDNLQKQQKMIINSAKQERQSVIDYINLNIQNVNDTISESKELLDKRYQSVIDYVNSAISSLNTSQNEKYQNIIGYMENTQNMIKNSVDDIEKFYKYLDKQPEIIKKSNQAFAVLNSEPYWANVYHDTIINSDWLKNKSVSPGRWAVSYIVLYVLYRILDEIKPRSILECGLGQSSKLTIQYADSYNAKLMICENNADWLSFFQRQFPTADKYTKILDTEMVNIVPEHESRTYAGFKSVVKDKKFDFVLIDGPMGSQHYSRPEILDIVDNLDKSFVILFDDMNRIGEQETWKLLEDKLNEKNISFKQTIYKSDKNLGLLCSLDLSWLTTL